MRRTLQDCVSRAQLEALTLTVCTRDRLSTLYGRARILDVADALGNELAEIEVHVDSLLSSRLTVWCQQHGMALCPQFDQRDSFGEGMRTAKQQVKQILQLDRERPRDEEYWRRILSSLNLNREEREALAAALAS